MFIHIGNNEAVLTKDIIMILDKSALLAKDTSDFLQVSQEEGFIDDDNEHWQNILKEKKTAIVLDKKILFSPISSVTLSKRSNFLKTLK
ncbi:MAG: extracellular matrix regulator RemB [Tepidanaerobacteraceae bacterium]|nr:DUF370 domain-containing protein [Thermoanaerobacterales bacterium]